MFFHYFNKKIKFILFLLALSFLIMGVIGYFTKIVFSVMLLTGSETVTNGLLYPRYLYDTTMIVIGNLL